MALRDQAVTKSRGNRNPEMAVGGIVIIRNDQTKRIFFLELAMVEQLMQGEDGIARAAVVRVVGENSNNSQLLRRSIQHLILIEVRYEGESDGEEPEMPEAATKGRQPLLVS